VPLSEIQPEWYRVAPPVLDGDEVVVPAEHTVAVEDMSEELLSAKLDTLWENLQATISNPRWGVNGIGASIVNKGLEVGNAKANDIKNWMDALYAEAHQKEAALKSGVDVDLTTWTANTRKPHSVSDIARELGVF